MCAKVQYEEKMNKSISFKGKPLTLLGRKLKLGTIAPNFKVATGDLQEKTLSDFKDKVKIITSFLSSDTPVCDLQIKEFNKRSSSLSNDVAILAISKDLPFAQKRFCDAFQIKNLSVLSDYKYSSFAINYGLLIKELNLVARSALILDKNNVLQYFEIVDEVTHPPNFDEALKTLEAILKKPLIPPKELGPLACKKEVSLLSKEQIDSKLKESPSWRLENNMLIKDLKFKDFIEAKSFIDLIAIIAEEQQHHPLIEVDYNKIKIGLITHRVKGLSTNDFIMASIIDELNNG